MVIYPSSRPVQKTKSQNTCRLKIIIKEKRGYQLVHRFVGQLRYPEISLDVRRRHEWCSWCSLFLLTSSNDPSDTEFRARSMVRLLRRLLISTNLIIAMCRFFNWRTSWCSPVKGSTAGPRSDSASEFASCRPLGELFPFSSDMACRRREEGKQGGPPNDYATRINSYQGYELWA